MDNPSVLLICVSKFNIQIEFSWSSKTQKFELVIKTFLCLIQTGQNTQQLFSKTFSCHAQTDNITFNKTDILESGDKCYIIVKRGLPGS